MIVAINGRQQKIENLDTLKTVLKGLNICENLVVIEHNGEIVDRSQFEKIVVKEGDSLEIVQFVGGG